MPAHLAAVRRAHEDMHAWQSSGRLPPALQQDLLSQSATTPQAHSLSATPKALSPSALTQVPSGADGVPDLLDKVRDTYIAEVSGLRREIARLQLSLLKSAHVTSFTPSQPYGESRPSVVVAAPTSDSPDSSCAPGASKDAVVVAGKEFDAAPGSQGFMMTPQASEKINGGMASAASVRSIDPAKRLGIAMEYGGPIAEPPSPRGPAPDSSITVEPRALARRRSNGALLEYSSSRPALPLPTSLTSSLNMDVAPSAPGMTADHSERSMPQNISERRRGSVSSPAHSVNAILSSISSRASWESARKSEGSNRNSRPSLDIVAPTRSQEEIGRFDAKEVVNGLRFECFFGLVIAVNACVFAAEAQYKGIGVGKDLGYPGSVRSSQDAWPGAETAFDIFWWVLGCIFVLELLLKLVALRLEFFWSAWNWFDLLVVVLWSVIIIDDEAFVIINDQTMRLIRLLRPLRLVRLVKTVQGFDSLHFILTALRGSMEVLLWSTVLLVVVQMILALFVHQSLHSYYFLEESYNLEERRAVFEYFGTFSRAMLTMFEMTLANWPPVCRLMAESVTEWWILFALAHKLTIGFAVIGVISGVFIQEINKAASADNHIMLRQKRRAMREHEEKMIKLFRQADQSGDGLLDLEEFRQIVSHPQVAVWLASMELDTSDVENLFQLIQDGAADISMERLVTGVARLKGSARSIDLRMMMRDFTTFKDEVSMTMAHTQRSLARLQVSLDKIREDSGDLWLV